MDQERPVENSVLGCPCVQAALEPDRLKEAVERLDDPLVVGHVVGDGGLGSEEAMIRDCLSLLSRIRSKHRDPKRMLPWWCS